MIDHFVIIAGPTASGKSALAVDLAVSLRDKHGVRSAIINADSMQVYNELAILTAQPKSLNIEGIRHYLYSVITPDQKMSVVEWHNLASSKIKELQQNDILPIVVGGTGFYINSLIDGIPVTPMVPDHIREYAARALEIYGRDAFYERLVMHDPRIADKISKNDTHRILRAFEVLEMTGKSILSFSDIVGITKPLNISSYVIDIARELNIELIETRTEEMVADGVIDEVREYCDRYGRSNCMLNNAIGCKEFAQYIRKEIDLESAIELVNIRARQYAKRQVTWFRNKMKDCTRLDFKMKQDYDRLLQIILSKLVDRLLSY